MKKQKEKGYPTACTPLASESERLAPALLQQQQQHSLFSQASWGRLEMKPERNKFKVQAPALLIELNTDVSSPFSIIIIVNS